MKERIAGNGLSFPIGGLLTSGQPIALRDVLALAILISSSRSSATIAGQARPDPLVEPDPIEEPRSGP